MGFQQNHPSLKPCRGRKAVLSSKTTKLSRQKCQTRFLVPPAGTSKTAFRTSLALKPQVSVPCSSLFDIVTVRCGHCTNLWAVNMAAVLQSLSWQDVQNLQIPNLTSPGYRMDSSSSSKCNKVSMRESTGNEERLIVNRPPEKRQRVPSAYNQFIKEEIQRIKASNPGISHREAFSTAAKNWAHFPHIHFGLMVESNKQAKLDKGSERF